MVRCSVVSPGREYNGREEQEKRKRRRVKRDRRRAGKTSVCRLFFTGKISRSILLRLRDMTTFFPRRRISLTKNSVKIKLKHEIFGVVD